MPSALSANFYITNRTDGHVTIEIDHWYGAALPQKGAWAAAPGQRVGPLSITPFPGGDVWDLTLTVRDGAAPGVYTASVVCLITTQDANHDILATVDTQKLLINRPNSGICAAPVERKGPLPPPPTAVQHVFVLMLENHSFDHLLGFSALRGADAHSGKPTVINGLKGTESNIYNNTPYPVQQPARDPMTTDPGHEFTDTLNQLCGLGTPNPFKTGGQKYPPINNSGFAASYATTASEGPKPAPGNVGDIMRCCNSIVEVSAMVALAKKYTVCDNWFASIPGPTWPNRFFAMGASSAGLDDSPSKTDMFEWETFDGFAYPNGSLFDMLTAAGLPWRLYNDWDNQFASNPDAIGGQIPIVSSLKGIELWDVRAFRHFAADLQGDYPYAYTFIEPNYGDIWANDYIGGSSQHPTDSLAAGERMIAATFNAIKNSPLWKNSVLIVTYDEHGGFYDHVAPPAAVPPGDKPRNKLNRNGFNFSQLGVRVPAVVVSPLIKPNLIDHTVYDHSSILKTVEEIFQLPPLTKRDANARSLRHLFAAAPVTDEVPESLPLPDLPEPPPRRSAEMLAAVDQQPIPEAGNLIGFLGAAMKVEIALSDKSPEARLAIVERVRGFRTRGEVREYLGEVVGRVQGVTA